MQSEKEDGTIERKMNFNRVSWSQVLFCMEARSKVYRSTEAIRELVGGLRGSPKIGIEDLTVMMLTPVKDRTAYASRAGGCGGSPF